MVAIDGTTGFGSWSPDGQRFVAVRANGFGVFTADGAVVATIPAREVHWVSPTSLAAFGSPDAGPAVGQVQYFSSHGVALSNVEADFERVVFVPFSQTFAGVEPAADDEPVGATYRVWDGSQLSEPRNGLPVAWAPDGSHLAILVPRSPAEAARGLGTLNFVDADGAIMSTLTDWVGAATGLFRSSPDGRYLAACLLSPDDSVRALHVVDIASSTVSEPVGECGFASWTRANVLYSSDASNPATRWSVTDGVVAVGTAAATFVEVSLPGAVASWSAAGERTLTVTDGETGREYELSGEIRQVVWAPDGTRVAVTSATAAPSVEYQVTIIRLL
jgi:hypothetical protein